jgi:4-deoxy-L-threo-5-hexosulose-uronate ketol-isomerase
MYIFYIYLRRIYFMDIRYSTGPEDFKKYTTKDVRREFLIETLFKPDEVIATYSHVDRMVAVGCMPVSEAVPLDKGIDCWKNFGTHYFLERREIGIFNVGGDGTIVADGTTYKMGTKDCLYVTMGTREVVFASADPAHPAKYYMVSAPAHKPCQTKFISIQDANKRPCGTAELSNDRVINQFIHPDVVETCQLCMGMTALKPGSVWNSMPPHTHERRMEIYFYFEVPEDQAVFHIMGQETETRHIALHNEQAVISPSWSMHCGCGTHNYTFIWAMGGENKEFDDMDNIEIQNIK